jgi:uncharacterized protein YkwD
LLGESRQQRSARGALGAAIGILVAGLLALPVSVAAASGEGCSGANLVPSSHDTAAVDAATLCLVDQIRRAHRLKGLRFNRDLQAVANSQVETMVSMDYFGDIRPSGATPAHLIAETPYGRHAGALLTAENIGWGTGVDATPAQMVAAWMRSVPHRQIVLSREFRDGGVGAMAATPARVTGGEAGATYALELATRG